MIRFESDYLEGALPEVMQALCDTNYAQTPGYGEDEYCREAADMIRAKCSAPDADVHFLVGGTQANMIVITAALRPHQAAIAAETGHIAVHETGSIEAAGHKVITLPSGDGKITAAQVRSCVEAHWNDSTHEHMAQPALVYISQPTENGTVYSLAELEALSAVCREKGLLFYVDGARLGTALVSSDMTLPDLARLTDAFYIGGTKLGALFGEAVVITNRAIARDFRYIVKQRGGMFAKGFLFGTQFTAYLQDELWLTMARHAVTQAQRIQTAAVQKGYRLFAVSPTNQVFLVLSHAQIERLRQDFAFEITGHVDDDHEAGRFVCSWATKEEAVDALIAAL